MSHLPPTGADSDLTQRRHTRSDAAAAASVKRPAAVVTDKAVAGGQGDSAMADTSQPAAEVRRTPRKKARKLGRASKTKSSPAQSSPASLDGESDSVSTPVKTGRKTKRKQKKEVFSGQSAGESAGEDRGEPASAAPSGDATAWSPSAASFDGESDSVSTPVKPTRKAKRKQRKEVLSEQSADESAGKVGGELASAAPSGGAAARTSSPAGFGGESDSVSTPARAGGKAKKKRRKVVIDDQLEVISAGKDSGELASAAPSGGAAAEVTTSNVAPPLPPHFAPLQQVALDTTPSASTSKPLRKREKHQKKSKQTVKPDHPTSLIDSEADDDVSVVAISNLETGELMVVPGIVPQVVNVKDYKMTYTPMSQKFPSVAGQTCQVYALPNVADNPDVTSEALRELLSTGASSKLTHPTIYGQQRHTDSETTSSNQAHQASAGTSAEHLLSTDITTESSGANAGHSASTAATTDSPGARAEPTEKDLSPQKAPSPRVESLVTPEKPEVSQGADAGQSANEPAPIESKSAPKDTEIKSSEIISSSKQPHYQALDSDKQSPGRQRVFPKQVRVTAPNADGNIGGEPVFNTAPSDSAPADPEDTTTKTTHSAATPSTSSQAPATPMDHIESSNPIDPAISGATQPVIKSEPGLELDERYAGIVCKIPGYQEMTGRTAFEFLVPLAIATAKKKLAEKPPSPPPRITKVKRTHATDAKGEYHEVFELIDTDASSDSADDLLPAPTARMLAAPILIKQENLAHLNALQIPEGTSPVARSRATGPQDDDFSMRSLTGSESEDNDTPAKTKSPRSQRSTSPEVYPGFLDTELPSLLKEPDKLIMKYGSREDTIRRENFKLKFPPALEFTAEIAFRRASHVPKTFSVGGQSNPSSKRPWVGRTWHGGICTHGTSRMDQHPYCCTCYYCYGHAKCPADCEYCVLQDITGKDAEQLQQRKDSITKSRRDHMRSIGLVVSPRLKAPKQEPPHVIDQNTANEYGRHKRAHTYTLWIADHPYGKQGRPIGGIPVIIQRAQQTAPTNLRLSTMRRTVLHWVQDAYAETSHRYRMDLITTAYSLVIDPLHAVPSDAGRLAMSLEVAVQLRNLKVTIRELLRYTQVDDVSNLELPDLKIIPKFMTHHLPPDSGSKRSTFSLSIADQKRRRAGIAVGDPLNEAELAAEQEEIDDPWLGTEQPLPEAQYSVHNNTVPLRCTHTALMETAIPLMQRLDLGHSFGRVAFNKEYKGGEHWVMDITDAQLTWIEDRQEEFNQEIRKRYKTFSQAHAHLPRPGALAINCYPFHSALNRVPVKSADFPATQPAGARTGTYHPHACAWVFDEDLRHPEVLFKLLLNQLSSVSQMLDVVIKGARTPQEQQKFSPAESLTLAETSHAVIQHSIRATIEGATHMCAVRRYSSVDAVTPRTTDELVSLLGGLTLGADLLNDGTRPEITWGSHTTTAIRAAEKAAAKARRQKALHALTPAGAAGQK